MAEFSPIPRPVVPTRLTTPVGPTVPIAGDVLVGGGVGSWVRPNADNDGLVIDSVSDVPATQLAHFHAGALPGGADPGDLLRLWGTRPALRGLLAAFLEVSIATPAGVVTNGHHVLRLKGSTSGSVDLNLNVAGQQRYTLDLAAPASLSTHTSTSGTRNALRSMAMLLQTTDDVTIGSVEYAQAALNNALPRRVGLLDAFTGEWLAYRDCVPQTAGTTRVRLPHSVDLPAGTPFFVGVETLDPTPGDVGQFEPYHPEVLGKARGSFEAVAGSPIALYPGNTTPVELDGGSFSINGVGVRADGDASLTLRDAIADRVNADQGDASLSINSTPDYQFYIDRGDTVWWHGWCVLSFLRFKLFGLQTGVALTGDVELRCFASGVPDATPADVNVRLEADASV